VIVHIFVKTFPAKHLVQSMSEPKWVIALGDCASRGCLFKNDAIVQGVDQIAPVDIYIAGCPPLLEALLNSILALFNKIEGQKNENPRIQRR
jgi:NADH-quinone oxidoreductase subunit B